tara:strand:+ start:51 stop:386 length:336 start_codon:yes stop_codon:yes gene_type:complete
MSEGEINENASAKVQLAFAAKVIALVGTAVWGYSVIVNRLNTLEMDLGRIQHELELNSEFRIKWPRGEIGALPADATQDMNIAHLKDRVDKLDEHVDKLRHGSNGGNGGGH